MIIIIKYIRHLNKDIIVIIIIIIIIIIIQNTRDFSMSLPAQQTKAD